MCPARKSGPKALPHWETVPGYKKAYPGGWGHRENQRASRFGYAKTRHPGSHRRWHRHLQKRRYEANPDNLKDIKTQYKNIIEYNDFQALEENNEKLVKAKDHIIIPPLDFCSNHIIGRGLLCQIKERFKAGKDSNVYVEGEVFPIKNVYELKGNDYTKAAVVIF